jgi:hypothetical protein
MLLVNKSSIFQNSGRLALDGLIRREYPGDWLRFLEIYTFAKLCQPSEIITLMPKPVTLFDSWCGY